VSDYELITRASVAFFNIVLPVDAVTCGVDEVGKYVKGRTRKGRKKVVKEVIRKCEWKVKSKVSLCFSEHHAMKKY
jgi:hypothetical protein